MTGELVEVEAVQTGGYDGIHEVILARVGPVERLELRYRADENGYCYAAYPGLHEALIKVCEEYRRAPA